MSLSDYLKSTQLPLAVQAQILRKMEGQDGLKLILKNAAFDGSATVVRDADFQWFDKAVTGVAGLIAATTLSAWAPGAIATLILLLYALRKKGVEVDALDAAILKTLKDSPASTASNIQQKSLVAGVTAEDIERRLNALAERTRPSPTGSGVVGKTPDGKWSTIGI
jgi:hypothetical protein